MDKIRVLFLDDMALRHDLFTNNLGPFASNLWVRHVWSARGAIDALRDEAWDVVWLDHDLKDEHYRSDGVVEETGLQVAKYIAEEVSDKPRFVVLHTANPVGREAMANCLKNVVDYVLISSASESGRTQAWIQQRLAEYCSIQVYDSPQGIV